MGSLLAITLLASPLQLALAEQPAPAQPAPSPAPAPAPADDFDLLPKEKVPDAAVQQELIHKLELRRKMLQLHQLGGFVTLGLMGTTVVLGQLNYSDKYGGGGDTERFMVWHRWLGISTAVVFAAAGALAVFAPSPLEKPVRLDTATVHKIALAIASAGIVAQIILGPVIASKQGQLSQRDFALAHQIVGYTTLVATAAGAVAFTF
jgi:hypothetical protein